MKKLITCFMAMTWLWVARGQQAGGLMQEPRKPDRLERLVSFNAGRESAETQLKQLLAPGNGQQFIKLKTKQDKQLGLETDVYQLYVKGLRVLGSEMRIVKQQGKLKYAFQSKALTISDLHVKANLNTAQALEAFLKKNDAKRYAWQDSEMERRLRERKSDPSASYYPKGELVIFPDSGKPVYLFEIYATDPYKREQVLVDAQSGDIVQRYDLSNNEYNLKSPAAKQTAPLNQLSSNNNLNVAEVWMKVGTEEVQSFGAYDPVSGKYYLNDLASKIHTQKIPGAYFGMPDGLPSEFESPTSFNGMPGIGDFRGFDDDPDYRLGTRVHYYAIDAYSYFLSKFNRVGYDGAQSPLDAFVYPCKIGGSFYNREQSLFFPYDNGILDPSIHVIPNQETVYHEYAHAFTVSESGLIGGSGQSGMLNEALSDIWANTMYDAYFKKNYLPQCQDPAACSYLANDWKTIAGNDGFQSLFYSQKGYSVIRDAKNPHNYNYPAFYMGQYWGMNGTKAGSDPHFNATVVSHWYYLLSEGGTVSLENDPSVTLNINGIGIQNAIQMVYLTTTNFLGEYSNFHEFALQTVLAAKIIFGESSAEVESVMKSWKAVGIELPPINSPLGCTPPDDYEPGFYVKTFSLANIQNSKPKEFSKPYSDYTNLNIEGIAGYTYELKLTAAGEKMPKGLRWSIWIDQDGNNSFDIAEKVAEGWPGTNLQLTLPTLVKGISTTMRIILSSNPNASPCYDPNDASSKYMEDYGMTIMEYCPIVEWTNPDFSKGNPQFTGIYFNNIKLKACGGVELFSLFPTMQQDFIDQTQTTLVGGKAYTLSFKFQPTPPEVNLTPAGSGFENHFLENCETQVPFGFSLGDFDDDLQKKEDEAGTEDVLYGKCPMVEEDLQEFIICPKTFKRFVWIDFNRNGAFDLNEKYTTYFDSLTKAFFVNFIVPDWATTLNGETVIRIYAYLGNGALYDGSACGNGLNGYPDKIFTGEPVISKNGIDIKIKLNKPENLFYMNQGTDSATESGPSGTEAAYEPVSLKVYPNPANDWVDISVQGTTTDNFTLEVYNTEGMRMLVQQPWNGRGLDVSAFPNGIYMISLKRDRDVYTQKLMIQR